MRKTAQSAVFVVIATLFAGAIFSTRAGATQQADPKDKNALLLAERLGVDDDYVISLLFGGDLHGSLDPCG